MDVCSRAPNNRINKLHELALRLVSDHYKTMFLDLVVIYGPFTSITQIFKCYYLKCKQNLSECCLNDLFNVLNNNYDLGSQSDIGVPGTNTIFCGANPIRYFGSVILNSLPNDLRNICDFDLIKSTKMETETKASWLS